MDNPGDATDPEPISDVGFSGEEPTFPLSVTGVLHLGAGVQTPGERADGYHGHERPRGATNGAHSERAGVKDATGCGEGPKGGTVEVESEVDPVVPLPLEAAEAVATSQLEYLLSLSARDASAQRAKAARLRRLGKRSRLTADDANTVVQLREQLVATQAELDAFKARVVKHKEQFQASVLVLRERTEDQLVEAEGLRARVTALEAACDKLRREKLQIQDGAAKALQTKDEEIAKLKAQLEEPRRQTEAMAEAKSKAEAAAAAAVARAERAERKAAADIAAAKAECERANERTKLKYAQAMFMAQKTMR